MKADAKTTDAVLGTLKTLWTAYVHKDLDGVMACWVPEEHIFVYGAGADECCAGAKKLRKGYQRDFEQSGELVVKLGRQSVYAVGDTAWAVGALVVASKTGKQINAVEGRCTTVFVRREGKWLVAHSHFSVPNAAQKKGASFPERKKAKG